MFAHSFLGKALVRAVILAAVALVLWSILARPSGAHGPKIVYRVKIYDTLWTIAQSHYGGDVRDAVWQIQQANHLSGQTIVPGEKLILP
jgi:nucleoid-associated protein YgaU